MGPNVLTTRSFQVVLTEMGPPVHSALLPVHPKSDAFSGCHPAALLSLAPGRGWLYAGSLQHQCLISGPAAPLLDFTVGQSRQGFSTASSESPLPPYLLLLCLWLETASAAITTEHNIQIVKHSLHCRRQSKREL